MNRIAAVVALPLLFCMGAAPGPKLPRTLECVSVYADGELVSVITPTGVVPDAKNLDAFKAVLMSAVNLAGRSNNRPDVIQASTDIQLIDNPTPPLDRKPRPRRNPDQADPKGCFSVCHCAEPVYCTEAVRQAPGDTGGRAICGCGPGCGTCERCDVVCPR